MNVAGAMRHVFASLWCIMEPLLLHIGVGLRLRQRLLRLRRWLLFAQSLRSCVLRALRSEPKPEEEQAPEPRCDPVVPLT